MRHQFKFMQKRWFKNIKFITMCAIVLSVSLLLTLAQHSTGRYPLPLLHFFGWAGLLFFGSCFLSFAWLNIKYLCQRRTLVAFTDEGLLHRDNLIPWGTITDIHCNGKLIVINTDGRKGKRQKTSPITRFILRCNKRLYGGKFTISEWDYDGTPKEFCEKIREEWRRAKRA